MKVAVVTVGRSDYGILRPLLRRFADQRDTELYLITGDAHEDARFGVTGNEILEDGFSVTSIVTCLPASDGAIDIATSIGKAVQGFAEAYAKHQPDWVVVLGDRFEALAATIAAQPFLIPIAHIGGGSLTQGALDDGFRHAMTKLSHLHFVETPDHADVVRQLGESPGTIHHVGALGLDNLAVLDDMSDAELEAFLDFSWNEPPVLVTLHPETHSDLSAHTLARETFQALEAFGRPVVMTYPNADQDGQQLIAEIDAFAKGREDWFHVRAHLGTRAYFAVMRRAALMVGNSSSGIIEAGAFGLPVVDIGNRQKGRARGPNVLNCTVETPAIADCMAKAMSLTSDCLDKTEHIYGSGGVAAKIIDIIQNISDGRSLVLEKQFRRQAN